MNRNLFLCMVTMMVSHFINGSQALSKSSNMPVGHSNFQSKRNNKSSWRIYVRLTEAKEVIPFPENAHLYVSSIPKIMDPSGKTRAQYSTVLLPNGWTDYWWAPEEWTDDNIEHWTWYITMVSSGKLQTATARLSANGSEKEGKTTWAETHVRGQGGERYEQEERREFEVALVWGNNGGELDTHTWYLPLKSDCGTNFATDAPGCEMPFPLMHQFEEKIVKSKINPTRDGSWNA